MAAHGLHLLGQMLQFLATLHDESFLLNVVSPAGFWVDELQRVHFLGTENVVDDRHAIEWRGLFPAERYAQGFVAPELLQPTQPPSRASDLYGWAALAWFLLTGESPAKLAADQHQRWAKFEAAHRERLRRELARLSPAQVADVQRELGVAGARFESLWPESFLDGLWSCLDTDPARRPGSVAALRAWWGNPPPPPAPACLAVRQAGGTTRIVFSTSGHRAGLQYQVSRLLALPPHARDEGGIVWKGLATERIETRLPPPPGSNRGTKPQAEWCLSLFVMETVGGITSASRPTVAMSLDGTVAGFRRAFAESLVAVGFSVPEEVLLLSELDPVEVVADELLDSSEPHVRRWAISLLERGLEKLGAACLNRIQARGLTDDDYDVRLHSAGALIRTSPSVDAATVVDLAQRLGGDAVDDMLRAASSFATFGVAASVIEAASEVLEQQHRIVVCPACQQELRARELDPHLTTTHGYVPIEGKLLPFGQALTRLWSRVLRQFDTTALHDLTRHLQQRHAERAVSAFAAALSQQVVLTMQLHQSHLSDNQRRQWTDDLARCLRLDNTARSACRSLLAHEDSRIRFLARSVALIEAAFRLVDEQVPTADFRRVVDELAPIAIVTERIEVCRRLVELGANPLAGELCERELELERLVDCPECGTTFAHRDLPRHRRREHQVFEWEGSRYSGDDLVALLLERTVSTDPDAFAARSLEELFVEQHGHGAWQPLYLSLRGQLLRTREHGSRHVRQNVDEEASRDLPRAGERGHEGAGNSDAVAAVVMAFGSAASSLKSAIKLSRAFLKEEDPGCQAAGLAIFTNLDGEPPADLSREAASRLGQTEIPHAVCQHVAIHLLRRPKPEADVCRRALLALASRAADKLQGIDLLHSLEQWVGPSPAIEEVCDELLSQIRMRCPRCDVRLTPPELAEHVRAEHSLVLEGRSVRQPWSVAMDRLEEYGENPKSQLLEQAEQLAELASPKDGRTRLWREALRRSIAPAHYRRNLIESIKSTTYSLCPECWESLSTNEAPLNEVHLDAQGNLHWDDVSITRVGLHGLWTSVEITPWDGPTPRWSLTPLGGVMAVAMLLVVPAMLCLILAWQGHAAMQAPGIIGMLAGVIGIVATAGLYKPRATDPVDIAWELIVPATLDHRGPPFGASHSAFLASLARVSCGRGNAVERRSILNQAIQKVQGHLQPSGLPLRHLAELWHLFLCDELRTSHGGETILHLLRATFHGEVPLEFLDQVTRKGSELLRLHDDPFYTHTLPSSLISAAAATGLSNDELNVLRRASPTLAFVLRDSSEQYGLRTQGANRELMQRILTSPGTRCPQCETWLRLHKGQLAQRMSQAADSSA